jgi:hypothetical protein
MKPFRLSIAGVLGFVLLCAIGCIALREASMVWVGAVAMLTVQLLLYAAARAFSRRERHRVFWLTFLAFGGGYLLFCFAPLYTFWVHPFDHRVMTYLPPEPLVSASLPTSQMLEALWPHLQPAGNVDGPGDFYGYGRGPFLPMTSSDAFGRDKRAYDWTGHLLFSWIIGGVGGLIVSTVDGIFARISGVARLCDTRSSEGPSST